MNAPMPPTREGRHARPHAPGAPGDASRIVRRVRWSREAGGEGLLSREWLVTSGLGGYASGTVAGVGTRRYHGLLVAALANPLGRVLVLNHLREALRVADGTSLALGGHELPGQGPELEGVARLVEFRLEAGLPVWLYAVDGALVEKRLFMPHLQNTVFVRYRMLEGQRDVRLELRPAVNFRSHDAPVSTPLPPHHVLTAVGDRLELAAPAGRLPPLRLRGLGRRAVFTIAPRRTPELLYRVEASRGYEAHGELHEPGWFRMDLAPGVDAALVASTEPWERIEALGVDEALAAELERRDRLLAAAHPVVRDGLGAELVLAADQFLVHPVGRQGDEARAHAAGDEVRTVIAGYHWFTDWGRDTMISLEGLTLRTGRLREAGDILRMFARHLQGGLIPNLFPEGESEGRYNTADATLWFFHALERYLEATGDLDTLHRLLPALCDVIEQHRRGTRFGIAVDPADGLLSQGAPDVALTWMDANMQGWVVTPRRGKAVEINALWYNALRLAERWLRDAGRPEAPAIADLAERCHASFNARFWYAPGGYLYDLVDGEQGDDPACRPNQIFAISLPHAVLHPSRWEAVLATVEARLLTPVGLRTLSREHPDYKPTYHGDLRTRDAAYHQGTVWSWLVGPFVDAWLRVHPGEREQVRRLVEEGLERHLGEACIGTISEVFDAEPPFQPRGCVAQAWGVAELLSALVVTSD